MNVSNQSPATVYDVYMLQDHSQAFAEFPDGSGRQLSPLELEALKASTTVRLVPRQRVELKFSSTVRVFTGVFFVQGGQAVLDGLKVRPAAPPPPVAPAFRPFDADAAAEALNDGDALAGLRVWLGEK